MPGSRTVFNKRKLTIKALLLPAILAAALSAQEKTAPAPESDPWQPLRFLLGTWEAKTSAGSAGAASSASYAFQLELRDHVLARHTVSRTGCQGPSDFDCNHSDILYIYRDSKAEPIQAIYFDNEGHTIHYNVTTPDPTTAIFTSDVSRPGPTFRLVYERKGNVMQGKFQIRAPGQSEFKSYLEWSGAKQP